MDSNHLWPAGGIIAILLSPFVPAMGDRLVGWLWRMFGGEGTPSSQREVVPEVGVNAGAAQMIRDAVREGIEEGFATDGRVSQLTEDVRRQREQIQHLAAENERLRNDVRSLRNDIRSLQASTYTITSTITRHAG
ncbi:hypothetical protein B0A52_04047 [Exophiala mesophila]|uniref:Uncharacterized protein n=1 Tax=Exophiala mesophila TaxID=212818 RepID=A0A438NA69_EXOME|nr:hypothetical protein B0A52_04047 [Exophiala mesophila]